MVVFGTNIVTRPPASVKIFNPSGDLVDSYSIARGDIAFNISNLTSNVTGLWVCNITVEESNITQPGGEVIDRFIVGEREILVNVSLLSERA